MRRDEAAFPFISGIYYVAAPNTRARLNLTSVIERLTFKRDRKAYLLHPLHSDAAVRSLLTPVRTPRKGHSTPLHGRRESAEAAGTEWRQAAVGPCEGDHCDCGLGMKDGAPA